MQSQDAEEARNSSANRGQEEALAAINRLQASYDDSLQRLHSAHADEVASLEGRVQSVLAERREVAEQLSTATKRLEALSVWPAFHCEDHCAAEQLRISL